MSITSLGNCIDETYGHLSEYHCYIRHVLCYLKTRKALTCPHPDCMTHTCGFTVSPGQLSTDWHDIQVSAATLSRVFRNYLQNQMCEISVQITKLWNKQTTKGRRLSNDRGWRSWQAPQDGAQEPGCAWQPQERTDEDRWTQSSRTAWKVKTAQDVLLLYLPCVPQSQGSASLPIDVRKSPKIHCSIHLWPSSCHCLTETRLLQVIYLCPTILPLSSLDNLTSSHCLWPSKVTYFPISQDSQRVACFTIICFGHFSSKFLSHSAYYEGFFFLWRSTRGSIWDWLSPLWLLLASVTPWVLDFKFH